MSKIRTLIVDDEPLARERIAELLASDQEIEIIGECADGRKAVAAIREQSPDLLFLDVQMPVLDGFEVLKAVGGRRMPAVIFVTAYDQYALRAFDFHALDYLLKPFSRARFKKALQRAKHQIEREQSGEINQRLISLLEQLKEDRKHLDRLVIKSGGRVFFLKTEEIDWIDTVGNYVRLHVGKESHLMRETLNGLESKLDPDRFLRIHRSSIVNIDRIKELQPWFNGEYMVLLRDGTQLNMSRGYREKLSDHLKRLI
jgi:two-component system, LytTR family, response regulator